MLINLVSFQLIINLKLKKMSDSEDEDREIPMPKYRVRFSDMPVPLQEGAVRLIDECNRKHKLDKDVATEIKN